MIKPSHPFYCALLLALVSAPCAAVEPSAQNISPAEALTQSDIESAEETWPDRAREVLMNALSLTGVRYKYGGNSPETGFDCSGFVRYVFKQATSLSLPHNALAISRLGQAVPRDELKPGDLVFFNTLKRTFSHVGIYVGDDRFIHSPSSGGKVKIESMQTGYWATRYNGAQRLEQVEN